MKLGPQRNYYKGQKHQDTLLTNLPIPHDLCTGDPIFHLLTMGNKALVGEFSVTSNFATVCVKLYL